MSDSLFPVLVEVPEVWDRFGQNPFFSGGEGLRHVSRHFRLRFEATYREIHSTIIDDFDIQSARLLQTIFLGVQTHTTHFVLHRLLAFLAAYAHRRRCLGPHCINLLKCWSSTIL